MTLVQLCLVQFMRPFPVLIHSAALNSDKYL
jgi:hypothetical protein